ncbi:MAG: hybrid sensor histidine kinase/response regulator [Sulfuriflexus sp.]|nr:hybrid sensor histidine kinase/response regulator [Sulfuriflexus sp.]
MNKRTRVLIVDDDERNVKILYEILEDEFELYSACDGETALLEVDKISPDVILLDIMMPGVDGYEVCRRLKISDESRGVKIILVSGKALTEERLKGYEVGADDFVVKPFDMDEIHAKVHVFAKLKSMEEVNKLKTDFLNLINHETGTPLNHIIGTSDLLLMNDDLDAETADGIKDISKAAHSLSNKISNILFLSKLKQQTLSDLDDIDVSSVLSDISSFLGDVPENIEIKFDVEEGQSFKGNFVLIQKLFLYIFKNAVEVSGSLVSCRAKCSANNDGILGVSFEIEDSGSDISDAQLQNFFDPFHVDDLMLHSEGLNTTMAICSEIITLHHGNIGIKRNEPSGICLSIWLPHDLTD